MLISTYTQLFNEAQQQKQMVTVLHDVGAAWLIQNGIYVNNTELSMKKSDYWDTNKHKAELFRFYFNSDNDEENKETLDGLIHALSDGTGYEVSMYNNDYSSKINGVTSGTSSYYFSYTICIKNKETGKDNIMFICNRNSGTEVFASKDLTPSKLLNLKQKNSYENVEDLISDITTSIDKRFRGEKYTSAVFLIKEIISIISVRSNYNIYGFTSSSVDDFFYNTNKIKILIDLINTNIKLNDKSIKKIKELFVNQTKNTIRCIEKDFGEILGPIIFMTLFKNVTVTFPISSNEKLIDYFINGHKVSAKQEGGGSNSSGAGVFNNLTPNSVNGSKKKQQELMSKVTVETNKMKEKEEESKYTEVEREFIDSVASTYSKSCCLQQIELISKFLLYNKKLKKKFKSYKPVINDYVFTDEQIKIFSSITSANDTKLIDEIVGDDPKSFFKELFKKINYKPSSKTLIKYDQLDKSNWDKLHNKYGALVYPLFQITVKIINSIYKDEKICGLDVITSIINKQIDMKQVYFGIKQNKCCIECIASKAATWCFTTGRLSINKMSNTHLAIQLIK